MMPRPGLKTAHRLCLVLCVFGQPALSQEALRPPPDYFIDAVFSTSLAQAIARACPEVSVDPVAAIARSGAVTEQLEADGFDVSAPNLGMSSGDAAIKALQDAFVAKHGLKDGAATEQVCNVARAEMAEGTAVGGLLAAIE